MRYTKYLLAALNGGVGGMAIGTVNYGFGVFVNGIAQTHPSWTRTSISGALSVMSVCAGSVSPIVGTLLDRFGLTVVIPCCILLQMSGFVCLSFMSSVEMLYVSYVLLGIGHAGTAFLGVGKAVGQLFPGPDKGRVMGFVTAFNNLSGLIFTQVTTAISKNAGWPTAARVYSFLMATLCVAYVLIMRKYYYPTLEEVQRELEDAKARKAAEAQQHPSNEDEDEGGESYARKKGSTTGHGVEDAGHDHSEKNNRSNGDQHMESSGSLISKNSEDKDFNQAAGKTKTERGASGVDDNEVEDGTKAGTRKASDDVEAQSEVGSVIVDSGTNKPSRSPFVRAICSPAFVVVALGSMCAEYTYNGVLSQIIPALVAEGMTEEEAAGVVSLVAGLGVASKIGCGVVSEKITAKRAIALCMVLEAIALFFLAGFAPNVYALWLCTAIYGASFGGIGALRPLVILETFGNTFFGRIYGVILMLFLIPSLTSPLVAGLSYDTTGRYMRAFIIAGIIFLVGAVLLEIAGYLVRKRDRLEQQQQLRELTPIQARQSTPGRAVENNQDSTSLARI